MEKRTVVVILRSRLTFRFPEKGVELVHGFTRANSTSPKTRAKILSYGGVSQNLQMVGMMCSVHWKCEEMHVSPLISVAPEELFN